MLRGLGYRLYAWAPPTVRGMRRARTSSDTFKLKLLSITTSPYEGPGLACKVICRAHRAQTSMIVGSDTNRT